jgi:hypothetical protein
LPLISARICATAGSYRRNPPASCRAVGNPEGSPSDPVTTDPKGEARRLILRATRRPLVPFRKERKQGAMESATDILDPWFVTGLAEGEGCFMVSFTLRPKLRIGIETRPSFSISLNERDLPLVQSIHAFFGCGAVRYSRADRTYKFESRSARDLMTSVIPHFQQYPLHGRKAKDFEIFVEICRRVHTKLHMDREHLRAIIRDAYRMNPSGKRRQAVVVLLRQLDELKV